MLHSGDDIDQKSRLSEAVKGHDENAEVPEGDCHSPACGLTKARQEKATEHSQHHPQAATEQKTTTDGGGANLKHLGAHEHEQSEDYCGDQ